MREANTMDLSEYNAKLIKRDITVLTFIKHNLGNLRSINKYLKPYSGYSSSVNRDLSNYNAKIEAVKYIVDESVYNKCRRVYNEYNKNLNLSHNSREVEKQRIIKLRDDVEKYIDECVTRYNELLVNL